MKFPGQFRLIELGVAALGLLALTSCKTPPPPPPQERSYVFFPAPPEEPHVQFLCNLSGELPEFTPPGNSFLDFLVGERQTVLQSLVKPYGLDMRNGRLYVADTIARSVALIDFNTKRFSWLGSRGQGALSKPVTVRIGPDESVYVADTKRMQIIAFDKSGRYRAAFGDGKTKLVDTLILSNELYALDIDQGCIKVFNLATTRLKRTIGREGSGQGEFNHPNALASDQYGNIYVCDAINLRIEKLDPTGKPVMTIGSAGKGPGQLVRPRGLAVARDGTVYIADTMMGFVQLFNPQGQPLMALGRSGFGEGDLALPAQVALDYEDIGYFQKYVSPDFIPEYLILVANQVGGNKISVFAFGHPKDPSIYATQPESSPAEASPTNALPVVAEGATTNAPAATSAPGEPTP